MRRNAKRLLPTVTYWTSARKLKSPLSTRNCLQAAS